MSIEMTTQEKDLLMFSKTHSTKFINFYEGVIKQATNIKLGLQSTPELYKELSEEQLMDAWLHPEVINGVDK